MTKVSTFKNNDAAAFAFEQIVRETDKAVLVRVANLSRGHTDVWFPKSQVEIGQRHLFTKFWLLASKARDTGAAFCAMVPALAREIEAQFAPALAA